MCQRLAITAAVLIVLVLMTHFWLQFLVVFVMYALLNHMEACLKQACHCLMTKEPISFTLSTFMHVYSFAGLICALICTVVLFKSLDESFSFINAVVSACLLSLFVFLVFGSMKHIAFLFRFFRSYDIENGALSLLVHQCYPDLAVLPRRLASAPVPEQVHIALPHLSSDEAWRAVDPLR